MIAGVTIGLAVAMSFLPQIPQPQWYHDFADKRGLWDIPNLGDVASNIPFAIAGFLGLAFLIKSGEKSFVDSRERWPFAVVFVGLVLTAVGSSYYHLAPDNARLVWDRIPMTVVFLAMVASVIAERISVRGGLVALPILIAMGIASVLLWYRSELAGVGDLRFYAGVQVYAGLVLLVAMMLPPRYDRTRDLGVIVGFYVLAKILEMLDKRIFAMGHIVSGHTLKHLAGAAAGYWIVRMVRLRSPVGTPAVKAANL